jgi:hypothetical protein
VAGVRGNATIASNLLVGGRAVRSVYTEDGTNVYAWSYDVDVVKSQVVEDKWRRIYYTIAYADVPLIKVARTHRVDANGNITAPVIGSSLVGGNWQPPENSTPGAGFGNFGPDSWVLGVPDPDLEGVNTKGEGAPPELVLVDRPKWPGTINVGLRVTYFLETPTGEIVSQKDLSNTENPPGTGNEQVYYTNNHFERGNKIQDMWWPLGGLPRPFKYYWFLPPDFGEVTVGRQVIVTNDTTGSIIINYGNSIPANDGIMNPVIDQA